MHVRSDGCSLQAIRTHRAWKKNCTPLLYLLFLIKAHVKYHFGWGPLAQRRSLLPLVDLPLVWEAIKGLKRAPYAGLSDLRVYLCVLFSSSLVIIICNALRLLQTHACPNVSSLLHFFMMFIIFFAVADFNYSFQDIRPQINK